VHSVWDQDQTSEKEEEEGEAPWRDEAPERREELACCRPADRKVLTAVEIKSEESHVAGGNKRRGPHERKRGKGGVKKIRVDLQEKDNQQMNQCLEIEPLRERK